MGMKKETDPGLKYLQEIGFTRLRGQNGLYRNWKRIYGRDKASYEINISGTFVFHKADLALNRINYLANVFLPLAQ